MKYEIDDAERRYDFKFEMHKLIAQQRINAIGNLPPEQMEKFMGKLRSCNAFLDALSQNSGK